MTLKELIAEIQDRLACGIGADPVDLERYLIVLKRLKGGNQ